MDFREYQQQALETRVREDLGLTYYALGLAGESGECVDKIKKIIRDQDGVVRLENLSPLLLEMGDVLWYLTMLANELNFSLETVALGNLDKLAHRKRAGTIQGSGDNR